MEEDHEESSCSVNFMHKNFVKQEDESNLPILQNYQLNMFDQNTLSAG